MSCEEAAETFCVTASTVQRVLRQFNTSGTVEEAGTSSGHHRELSETEETIPLDIVLDNPWIYLDEIKSTFEGLTGKSVRIRCISQTSERDTIYDVICSDCITPVNKVIMQCNYSVKYAKRLKSSLKYIITEI